VELKSRATAHAIDIDRAEECTLLFREAERPGLSEKKGGDRAKKGGKSYL
jgi:hypothetical protein